MLFYTRELERGEAIAEFAMIVLAVAVVAAVAMIAMGPQLSTFYQSIVDGLSQ